MTEECQHCFCRQNVLGDIVCCRCGKVLEKLYDKPDIVLMWEQMGRWKRIMEGQNDKQDKKEITSNKRGRQ